MILCAVVSTILFILAYTTGILLLAVLPFLFPVVLLLVKYPPVLYALLFITIPFSRHVSVGMGISTELFSEQVMWLICVLGVLLFLIQGARWDYKYLVHPITLFLLLHLIWTGFTALTSEIPAISMKFLLSKLWFTLALFAGGLFFFRQKSMWKTFFWCTYLSLMVIIAIIMVKHAQAGFTFESISQVVSPMFSTHVQYATALVLFLPFILIATRWYETYSFLWWCVILGIMVFPAAIVLSYTRAAIIVMVIYPIIYLIFRWKIARWAVIASFIGAVIVVGYFLHDKTYLKYAPNYETTTTYEQFGRLINATFEGEDMSTMERVYRWVAGYNMFQENPILGYGPGTFPEIYKKYTVNMFSTYVSANKSGSGIHSYYFMVLVEQGILGLLIFLSLIYLIIVRGEKVYHRVKDKFSKEILIGFLVSFVGLMILILINDMLEVDKMAAYFFWTMVAVILFDFKTFERKPTQKDALDA